MNSVAEPVVIIGSGSGIGASLTRALVSGGRSVVGVGRTQSKLDALMGEIDSPSLLSVETADVTDESSVKSLLESIKEKYGSISGVVNCAGSVLLKPTHLTSLSEFEATFAVNVKSCFLLLKYGIPLLPPAGGSIVFFSTAAARAGLPHHDVIAAAKSAVEGLTRSAAATYASKHIRINAVAPGLVKTGLTERIHANPSAAQASLALHALGRLGEPDEVASLVVWLLSAESSWMTGQTIALDGGLSLRAK